MTTDDDYVAIHEQKFIAQGSLEEIVHQVKLIDSTIEPFVIETQSCKRIELNWHGNAQTVVDNLPGQPSQATTKRGRPKLGVISKEVTLLPRHWEWLRSQPGGASVTLRKLVEHAQKNVSVEELITMKQQLLDGFMLLIMGDSPGFEEASRSLYRNSKISFKKAIDTWPDEIKNFVLIKFNEIANMHSGNP
jgi:uncharacterized protein